MYPSIETPRGNNYSFIDLALEEIHNTYGHRTQVGRKSLLKFGRAPDIGSTDETEVNTLNQSESYVSDNLITHISSTNAGDSNNMVIEGMTLSNGVLTFSIQTVVLDGQTKTALTTPLARVTRAYNDDLTDLLGDVYIYQDTAITAGVPDDLANAHLKILAASGQSEKAATSVAGTNYFIQTEMYAYINKKQAANVNIRMRTRKIGKAFRTNFVGSISSTGVTSMSKSEKPFRIIAPNSDISITAESSVSGVDISAGFSGFFADII